MRELDETVVVSSPPGPADDEQIEVAFVPRHNQSVMLEFPNGLVASSDRRVRRDLAHMLAQCGFESIITSTVAETEVALLSHEVSIVLCNDRLGDGNYEDILRLLDRSDRKVPVIVVSRTGEWTEYLAAIRVGVFDYLAYPTIPGDLQRVIRKALGEKHQLDAA